jgi:hypothetical protein
MARWTVYTRPGCTLCDTFLMELAGLLGSAESARVQVVDISDDAALEARYSAKIPVLTCDGEFVCCYRVDAERIRAHLTA